MGPNIAKSFLTNQFGDIAPPFCTGGLYRKNFFAKIYMFCLGNFKNSVTGELVDMEKSQKFSISQIHSLYKKSFVDISYGMPWHSSYYADKGVTCNKQYQLQITCRFTTFYTQNPLKILYIW